MLVQSAPALLYEAAASTLQPGDAQPVFSIVPWEMIFTLVNFVILFFILKKFLLGPVKKILAQRQQMIEGSLHEAKQANSEAAELKTQYEQKLSGAKQEAAQIIASANQLAQHSADKVTAQAQEKAAQTLQRAEKEVERQKKKAVNEIKDEVADLAVELSGKIVRQNLDKEQNRQLIDQFLDELK